MPGPNGLSNIMLLGQKQIKRTNSVWKFVINIEELNHKVENKKVQKYKDECVTLNRKHYVVVQTQMVSKNTKIPVLQNSPTIVLIKILECFVKMFITFKFVPMHCSLQWNQVQMDFGSFSSAGIGFYRRFKTLIMMVGCWFWRRAVLEDKQICKP